MLIGSRPDDRFFVVCWSCVRESTVGSCKMPTSDVCFACLAWLHELFVGTLISLMNAYVSCSRPTLNFIECLGLRCSITQRLVSQGRYIKRVARRLISWRATGSCMSLTTDEPTSHWLGSTIWKVALYSVVKPQIMSTSLAWICWRCFAFFVLSYIVLSIFILFYATQVKRQKIWLLLWLPLSGNVQYIAKPKWVIIDSY